MESVSGRAAMDACNELRWTDPHKVQIGDSKRTGVPNRFTKRESKALYVLGYASWDMHLGICILGYAKRRRARSRAPTSSRARRPAATRCLFLSFFPTTAGTRFARAKRCLIRILSPIWWETIWKAIDRCLKTATRANRFSRLSLDRIVSESTVNLNGVQNTTKKAPRVSRARSKT